MEHHKQFRTFEDSETYRAAREFRKAMYGVSRRLPAFEKFEMASQVRRASLSLTNNISEGHGRWHWLDHIKYLLLAHGSLTELMDDFNACEDESYLAASEVAQLKQQGWHVLRLINGYLRNLRECKTGDAMTLREVPTPYGDTDDELESWIAGLTLDVRGSI